MYFSSRENGGGEVSKDLLSLFLLTKKILVTHHANLFTRPSSSARMLSMFSVDDPLVLL